MARNGMNDLRDHLFAALERLNDDELTPEQLSTEVEKAQAIQKPFRLAKTAPLGQPQSLTLALPQQPQPQAQ